MSKKINDFKCLLLLEFGIPHYRKYIYSYFKKVFSELLIIHSGEIFDKTNEFVNIKGFNLRLPNDFSLVFFNIFRLRTYQIIISTLNLRKLHTWLPFFLYRKKNWIFWGKGIQGNNRSFINSLRRKIINKSVGFVVYTDKGKNDLISIGVLPEKISVAYNTLKIDNAELTNGNQYLLYVGRIQKRKEIDKVIKALKGTNYKLLVVGDGYHLTELKKITVEKDMEKQVIFLEAIYDEEKLKGIFSGAVAYISPGSVGLGVVHSFAYGVPVITCSNSEQGPEFEYCNESNSYLYKFDSELRSVIENVFLDNETRLCKSRKAFEFYTKNLSYNNVYKAFDYQFSKIINETNHTIV